MLNAVANFATIDILTLLAYNCSDFSFSYIFNILYIILTHQLLIIKYKWYPNKHKLSHNRNYKFKLDQIKEHHTQNNHRIKIYSRIIKNQMWCNKNKKDLNMEQIQNRPKQERNKNKPSP